MAEKVPPPPSLPVQFQQLNRWLLELQSILNSQGEIDINSVSGLSQFITQTNNNFAALNASVTQNTSDVAALLASVAAISFQLAITPVVRNDIVPPVAALGKVGDWFADTVGLHIYVKTDPVTWTLII